MTRVWFGFVLFIFLIIILDMCAFHRRAREITLKEALALSGLWIGLALLFDVGIFFAYQAHWLGLGLSPLTMPGGSTGWDAALLFLTGYLVEKSLSVDNLFMMAVIFRSFGLNASYQHKVLFWGVIGALSLRGALFSGGAVLMARYAWLDYVFGGLLLLMAGRMLWHHDESGAEPSRLMGFLRGHLPVTEGLHEGRFVLREGGRRRLTQMGVALLAVEGTDFAFAMDSIPVCMSLITDPLLAFASNIFAVLGLRSLYFVLTGVLKRFGRLEAILALIVGMAGVKMLLKDTLHAVPHLTLYMLAAVGLLLGGGILVSISIPPRSAASDPGAPGTMP